MLIVQHRISVLRLFDVLVAENFVESEDKHEFQPCMNRLFIKVRGKILAVKGHSPMQEES
jgi:hypothetical protein